MKHLFSNHIGSFFIDLKIILCFFVQGSVIASGVPKSKTGAMAYPLETFAAVIFKLHGVTTALEKRKHLNLFFIPPSGK